MKIIITTTIVIQLLLLPIKLLLCKIIVQLHLCMPRSQLLLCTPRMQPLCMLQPLCINKIIQYTQANSLKYTTMEHQFKLCEIIKNSHTTRIQQDTQVILLTNALEKRLNFVYF